MHPSGTLALLEQLAHGPGETVTLGEVLDACGERAFGGFLLLAVLPAFLPLPAGAGAVSGPLVVLAGLQWAALAAHPWLPGWLQRRRIARASIARFRERLARPLAAIARVASPRAGALLDRPIARVVGGLLLAVLGVLLALPLPLTNYPFGLLLVVWAIAFIERDGRLLAGAWLLGLVEVVVVATVFDRAVAAVLALASG